MKSLRIILTFTLVVTFLFFPRITSAEGGIEVVKLSGEVFYRKGGGERVLPLRPGMVLKKGDSILTAEDAFVEVACEGRKILVDGDSVLYFSHLGETMDTVSLYNLARGAMIVADQEGKLDRASLTIMSASLRISPGQARVFINTLMAGKGESVATLGGETLCEVRGFPERDAAIHSLQPGEQMNIQRTTDGEGILFGPLDVSHFSILILEAARASGILTAEEFTELCKDRIADSQEQPQAWYADYSSPGSENSTGNPGEEEKTKFPEFSDGFPQFVKGEKPGELVFRVGLTEKGKVFYTLTTSDTLLAAAEIVAEAEGGAGAGIGAGVLETEKNKICERIFSGLTENTEYFIHYCLSDEGQTEFSDVKILSAYPRPFFDGGDGGMKSPYLISTREGLSAISEDLSAHYKLTSDLNLNGEDWQPIAGEFSGSLDGGGHVLKEMCIENPSGAAGLFAKIGSGGEVKNLGIIDFRIKTEKDKVGAITGENVGVISKVFATGEIESTKGNCGGLVGVSSGEISSAYTKIKITSAEINIGGIVGSTSAKIENCYSVGELKGKTNVGGLVGKSTYAVNYSFFVGEVIGQASVGGIVGTSNGGITHAVAPMLSIVRNESSSGTFGYVVGLNPSLAQPLESGYNWARIYGMDKGNMKGENGKPSNLDYRKSEDFGSYWDFASTWELNPNEYPRLREIRGQSDITPPLIVITDNETEIATEIVQGEKEGEATVNIVLDEEGLVYLLLLEKEKTSAVPRPRDMIAEQITIDGESLDIIKIETTEKEASHTFQNLETKKEYVLFLLPVDSFGNASPYVYDLPFTAVGL